MDYITMEIDDIIKWCQENNQVEWLKAEAAQMVECKIYPRHTVLEEVLDENGNVVLDNSGKPVVKKVSRADKSKAPKIEKRKIPFITIKKDFCEKFMPQLLEKKPSKPTMYDIIANL